MPPRRTSPSTPGGPTSQARYPNFSHFFLGTSGIFWCSNSVGCLCFLDMFMRFQDFKTCFIMVGLKNMFHHGQVHGFFRGNIAV